MRISDWSSDVCSSDLIDLAGASHPGPPRVATKRPGYNAVLRREWMSNHQTFLYIFFCPARRRFPAVNRHAELARRLRTLAHYLRLPSEERSVGKEGVRPC